MIVKNNERNLINDGIRKLKMDSRLNVNTGTQFGRVLFVAAGANWHTLRELESLIVHWFPENPDTQAAISARLREVSPSKCGLVKQRHHITTDKGKQVHYYRLVPASVVAELKEAA